MRHARRAVARAEARRRFGDIREFTAAARREDQAWLSDHASRLPVRLAGAVGAAHSDGRGTSTSTRTRRARQMLLALAAAGVYGVMTYSVALREA